MYWGEQNGGGTCNGPESLLLEITKNFMVAVALMIRKIYYLDTCVLLENTPLVKFNWNYIRDPSSVFFHILTNKNIDDIISSFSQFFVQTASEKYQWLEDIVFYFWVWKTTF